MRKVIYAAAIVLAVLHQDFWLWDDAHLWFGFMPAGFAYHVLFSVLSAVVWALAVMLAWPTDVEEEVKDAQADQETCTDP